MDAPTTIERKVLRCLAILDWEDIGSVCPGQFGAKTRAAMFEKNWIELAAEFPAERKRIRITQAGRDALAMPEPPQVPKRVRLKMAKPMLREAPPAIKRNPRKK